MKIWNEHLKESLIATLKFFLAVILGIIAIMITVYLMVLTKGVLLLFAVFGVVWAFVHHEKGVERRRKERYCY